MFDQLTIMNEAQNSFDSSSEALRRVAFVESQIRNLSQTLQGNFVLGRLRTDRTAPANSADVVPQQDLIYDRVLTSTFEYILINNAGTLEWRRITLNAF